ncbi:MAG TPA: MFS transporter, partial [Gemmatimonadaceae bacterium]|nr:MFS transporter [Gemmatimonadaceae bacterium]
LRPMTLGELLDAAMALLRRRAVPMLTAGVLLAGAGFALTGVAASTAALAATVVVWTFGEMVFSPVAGAYVADIAPTTMRGRYQAAFGLCHSVGLVIAPAAGTALYERSPALLWGACGALGVVAAALILTSPARAPLPVSGHPEPTAG